MNDSRTAANKKLITKNFQKALPFSRRGFLHPGVSLFSSRRGALAGYDRGSDQAGAAVLWGGVLVSGHDL